MATKRAFLNNHLLLSALAGFYPALFLASNNWFLYTKNQLATLLLFSPLFALLLGIICYTILYITQKAYFTIIQTGQFTLLKTKFQDNFFALFSFSVIFFLLQKTTTILMPNKIILTLTLIAIASGILFAVNKIGIKFLNIFFLFLVSLTAIQWTYSYYTSVLVVGETLSYSKDKSFFDAIQFQQKPNVYLIVLESYHNNEALKNIYNFDNKKTEKKLLRKGFEIYNNTFSNYWDTTTSILPIFTMDHHYYKISKGRHDALGARNIIGGVTYNPVLSVFKNNGYNIQYVHESDYCFFAGDLLDYVSPKRTPFKVFEIYQIELVNKFFSFFGETYKGKAGKRKDKDRVYVNNYNEIMKDRLSVAAEGPTPYFTFIKYGKPGHFAKPWNEIGSSIKKYPKDLKKANLFIMKLVNSIVKKDPGSFIILIGDHGAWRYRHVWKGENNIHMTMEERGAQATIVAQDLFGTFLAIKYPENSDIPPGIISHVNLFRYVFSVLCKDASLLKKKVADESYVKIRNKPYIAVRDGQPLKRWIPFHEPSQ